MPVHNAERFLPEALASLLGQNLEDWELIAVLDRCMDRSRAILEDLHETRIRIVEAPSPGGIVAALNHGLTLCAADFIARFDADDICDPRRLEVQARCLTARPLLAALGSAAILIDERSRPFGVRRVITGPRRLRRRLLWRNALIHPSVMFRRALVASFGGYEESPMLQDYVLWLRIAARADIDNLAEPLLSYRVHRTQQSRSFRPQYSVHDVLLPARIDAARRAGVTPVGATIRHAVWTVAQYRHYSRR